MNMLAEVVHYVWHVRALCNVQEICNCQIGKYLVDYSIQFN